MIFSMIGRAERDSRISIIRAVQIESQVQEESGLAARWFAASYRIKDYSLVVEHAGDLEAQLELMGKIRPPTLFIVYRMVAIMAALLQFVVFGINVDIRWLELFG